MELPFARQVIYQEEARPRPGAGPARHRPEHRRADDHQVRHPGAEAALARPDAPRRHGMGPGLLGTGGGLGPARACAPPPAATATSTSSTGRRSGRRTRATPTSSSPWSAREPGRAGRRASPTSSSTPTRPGVQVRPLRDLTGGHLFAEVFFDDVRVPVAEPDRRGERRLAAGPHQPRARAGGGRAEPGGDVPPRADRTGGARPRTRPAGRPAGPRPVRRPGDPGPHHPLQRRADHRRHPRHAARPAPPPRSRGC